MRTDRKDASQSSPVHLALTHAEDRLERFKSNVKPQTLLERLKTESPAHPVLLAYTFTLGLMSAGIALALVVLALPLFPSNLLTTVALFEARISMPLPVVLVALSLCCGALGAGLRQLAMLRAEQSPLLPEELTLFQDLSNEVNRLRSAKKLEDNTIGKL
jgi:hypothetical protein